MQNYEEKVKELVTPKERKMVNEAFFKQGFIADIGGPVTEIPRHIIKFLDLAAKEGRIDKGQRDWIHGSFKSELVLPNGTQMSPMGGYKTIYRVKDYNQRVMAYLDRLFSSHNKKRKKLVAEKSLAK